MKRLISGLLAVFSVAVLAGAALPHTFPCDGGGAAATLEKHVGGTVVGGKGAAVAIDASGRLSALAVRVGAAVKLYPWEDGRWFQVVWEDGRKAAPGEFKFLGMSEIPDGQRLEYASSEVRLAIEIAAAEEGDGLAFAFEIENQGKEGIVDYITLPVGWRPPQAGEYILPAWNGCRAPLPLQEKVHILYPGHLHSQWFGFQEPDGSCWLLMTEDDGFNTKRIDLAEGDGAFAWRHDLCLPPGRKYRCAYRTILRFWEKGDYNDMAHRYREWAVRQKWFKPMAEKLSERPIAEALRNGWVWHVGMHAWQYEHMRGKVLPYSETLRHAAAFRERFGHDILYWHCGWYGPFDSRFPQYFPVDERLGDFDDYAWKVQENGYFVALHTNGVSWNDACAFFDVEKTASWRGKHYARNVEKEHLHYVASLPASAPVFLEQYTRMAAAGIPGIYFDELGHAFASDDCPASRYVPETIGRCNWSQAKYDFWQQLRQAMPRTFFQTEANSELSAGVVDCNAGGSIDWDMKKGRSFLPLWQLTYGDAAFYIALYAGIGWRDSWYAPAINALCGALPQFPDDIHETEDARWLFAARKQPLLGTLAGKLMLEYRETDQWRIARYHDALVVVNDGPVRDGEFTCALGTVAIKGARELKHGAVTFASGRGLASDGAYEILLDGQTLWQCSDNAVAFAAFDGKLYLYNPDDQSHSFTCAVEGGSYSLTMEAHSTKVVR